MSKARAATDQVVKLIVGAGQASPSPPVGPALGSKGVKSMDFCKVCTFLNTSHQLGSDTLTLGGLQQLGHCGFVRGLVLFGLFQLYQRRARSEISANQPDYRSSTPAPHIWLPARPSQHALPYVRIDLFTLSCARQLLHTCSSKPPAWQR